MRSGPTSLTSSTPVTTLGASPSRLTTSSPGTISAALALPGCETHRFDAGALAPVVALLGEVEQIFEGGRRLPTRDVQFHVHEAYHAGNGRSRCPRPMQCRGNITGHRTSRLSAAHSGCPLMVPQEHFVEVHILLVR